jgi:rare lipoprotein A (peptidoglycan hydrolase)
MKRIEIFLFIIILFGLIFIIFNNVYTLVILGEINQSEDFSKYIAKDVYIEIEENNYIEGVASYYDYDLNRKDQKCLDNTCYSLYNSTCASRDFDRGTILKVTNLNNGKTVECRVNDYGPEEWTNRVLDMSSYAFSQVADLKLGLIDVKIEPL